MSTPGLESKVAQPLYRTERVIASLTTAWVIILTTYMIFQNHELSHTSIYFLKIILALSGAVMLATLPGFFDVNYNLGGFSVRAAGGAAAFVFIYTQSPNLPAFETNEAPKWRPGENGGPPKSGRVSALNQGYPALVAFTFAPASFLPIAARPAYWETSTQAYVEAPATPGLFGAESSTRSFSADIAAFSAAVGEQVRLVLRRLKALLDAAATIFRGAVEAVLGIARDLLGLGPSSGERPMTIGVVDAVSNALGELTAPLLGQIAKPIEALLTGVGDLSSSLLGGVSDTVDGVVGVTDRTVASLVGTVQTTSLQLLDGTDKLVGGVTQLVDAATGGLTSGLTQPVDALASGVTKTAGKLVDSVAPKAVETTSALLSRVNAGIDGITNGVNAISPKIVSRLDADFIAAERLGDLGEVPALGGKLTAPLGRLTDVTKVLEVGSEHPLFDAAVEPLCISGCGGVNGENVLGSTVGNTVSGLTGGHLLGGAPDTSYGASSPALALGGGGPDGNGAGPAGGGPVGATLQATGSLLGGVGKSLRRH